eukprot:11654120-Karenia_brevis.AAC.1
MMIRSRAGGAAGHPEGPLGGPRPGTEGKRNRRPQAQPKAGRGPQGRTETEGGRGHSTKINTGSFKFKKHRSFSSH